MNIRSNFQESRRVYCFSKLKTDTGFIGWAIAD
jgi:hypothetical protein